MVETEHLSVSGRTFYEKNRLVNGGEKKSVYGQNKKDKIKWSCTIEVS